VAGSWRIGGLFGSRDLLGFVVLSTRRTERSSGSCVGGVDRVDGEDVK